MKQSLFTFGAAFALAGVSHAVLLTDNFDSYTPLATMDLAGPWSVSNGASGSGPIAIATDYTFDGSPGAALIGGYAPLSAGPTVLSAGLTVPMFNNGYPSEYTMDFGFLDSTNAFRDDYKISLASTSGNLLALDLTPGASVNTFNISFSSDYFTGINNWGTFDALDTLGNPFFQVKFQTFTDGIGGMFYSLNDGNGGVMSSGSLSGGSLNIADNITGLSISVDTTGGAGDGFLVIDNVSAIPEPSSAMLLGLLGASFAFLRRREA